MCNTRNSSARATPGRVVREVEHRGDRELRATGKASRFTAGARYGMKVAVTSVTLGGRLGLRLSLAFGVP